MRFLSCCCWLYCSWSKISNFAAARRFSLISFFFSLWPLSIHASISISICLSFSLSCFFRCRCAPGLSSLCVLSCVCSLYYTVHIYLSMYLSFFFAVFALCARRSSSPPLMLAYAPPLSPPPRPSLLFCSRRFRRTSSQPSFACSWP